MGSADRFNGPFSRALSSEQTEEDPESYSGDSVVEKYSGVIRDDRVLFWSRIPEWENVSIQAILYAYLFEKKSIDTSKLQNTSKQKLQQAVNKIIEVMGDDEVYNSAYKKKLTLVDQLLRKDHPFQIEETPTVRTALESLNLNIRTSDRKKRR